MDTWSLLAQIWCTSREQEYLSLKVIILNSLYRTDQCPASFSCLYRGCLNIDLVSLLAIATYTATGTSLSIQNKIKLCTITVTSLLLSIEPNNDNPRPLFFKKRNPRLLLLKIYPWPHLFLSSYPTYLLFTW